jgi:hypothetical protein
VVEQHRFLDDPGGKLCCSGPATGRPGANDTLVQSDRDIAQEVISCFSRWFPSATPMSAVNIFSPGAEVRNKPFNLTTGQNPLHHERYRHLCRRTTRRISIPNILDDYGGNNKRIPTEIEKGSILDKNTTGSNCFIAGCRLLPNPHSPIAPPRLPTCSS